MLRDDLEEWGEEGDEEGNFHKMGIFMWFIYFFCMGEKKTKKMWGFLSVL